MIYIKYFLFIHFVLFSIVWSCEELNIDESSASAKAGSVNSAIAELTRRRTVGDSIATDILSKMSVKQFREKQAAIEEYNRKLREQEKAQIFAREHGLSVGSDLTPTKAYAAVIKAQGEKSQREAEEQKQKLQADILEEREKAAEQLRIIHAQMAVLAEKAAQLTPTKKQLEKALLKESATPYKRQLSEASAREAILTEAQVALKVRADELEAKLKEQQGAAGVGIVDEEALKELEDLREKLKTSEQRVEELEARFGNSALAEIQANEPVSSNGDIPAIRSMRASYFDLIEDIKKSANETSSVSEDSAKIREMLEAVSDAFPEYDIKKEGLTQEEKEEIRTSADSEPTQARREEMLDVVGSAYTIVSQYDEFSLEVLERKINDAKTMASLRQIVIDIFYETFLAKMSELEIRILNLDVLEQSLDATKLYLEFAKGLIELNKYPPVKITKGLTQFLNLNQLTLNKNIEEREEAIILEYLPSYEEVRRETDEKYARYIAQKSGEGAVQRNDDFSFVPIPIQLSRSYLAFFLLGKTTFTDKKFNDISIFDQYFTYLTKTQTKALFVYLCNINKHFSEYSKRFIEVTLSTAVPVQQSDVKELIQTLRKRLKTLTKEEAEKPVYSPAFNDKKLLRAFAETIDDLCTGAYAMKIIKDRLKSAQGDFNVKLRGVTTQGIATVLSSGSLSENQAKMMTKVVHVMRLFSQEVPKDKGIDSLSIDEIPAILELVASMKLVQKDINEKDFPIRSLIRDSSDYKPGDLLLEATVVPVATPVVRAAPSAKPVAGAAKSAAPAAELSEKEKAAIVKKEEAKAKLLITIEDLKQKLEGKRSEIGEDDYAELSAKLVNTQKMINDGNAMAQVAIRGLKSSIE